MPVPKVAQHSTIRNIANLHRISTVLKAHQTDLIKFRTSRRYHVKCKEYGTNKTKK